MLLVGCSLLLNGVKTRKLVGMADNVRVVARGVESSQVVLTTRTLHTAYVRRSEGIGTYVYVAILLQHGPTALAPMIKGGLIQYLFVNFYS